MKRSLPRGVAENAQKAEEETQMAQMGTDFKEEQGASLARMTSRVHPRWLFSPATLFLCCSVSLCLSGGSPVFAESVPAMIRKGNEQFRAGQFADALKTYEGAAASDPKSLEARFNRGVAAHAQGDPALAQGLFREVDAAGGNPALAAAARYNLGVIETQQLQAQPPDKPEAALAVLKSAASLFRGSLDLTPADADAARNLELTRLAIRDLQQQIDDMKKMQEEMKKLQEQLKENQEKQEQAAQQNQQRSADEKPDDQQKSESGQEQKPISEQTKDAQQKLDKLQQKMGEGQPQAVEAPQLTNEPSKSEEGKEEGKEGESTESQPQSPQNRMKAASKSLEQATKHQQQAENEIQQGDLKDAQKEQAQASEQLKKALEQLESPKGEKGENQDGEPPPESSEQQEGEQQTEEQPPPPEQQGEPMEQAEGEGKDESTTDARLGRILEKERRDKELKQQMLRQIRARNRPVDKDW